MRHQRTPRQVWHVGGHTLEWDVKAIPDMALFPVERGFNPERQPLRPDSGTNLPGFLVLGYIAPCSI